ncbi:MAG: calcineurin-like phosphoesterase family protein [Phycisphaeraceae bacterium]
MRSWMVSVLVVLGLASFSVGDTVTAWGVVFHDRNGDGVRQAGEEGLPGVAVSDGRAVVLTGDDGGWELEIDAADAIVFVVKPAGYQVVLDGLNLPRGYYVHKPAGSPDEGFIFEGVDPTGELPEVIQFALREVEESDRFTVIAFGDPQPYNLAQIDWFRREVVDPLVNAEGITNGAVFGISLGDLVGDNLDLFGPLNEAQALFGIPWYNVLGNHDMNFMSGGTPATEADPDRYSDETYERVFGPLTYAVQYGRVHLIVLDNVKWNGFAGYREGDHPDWSTARRPVTNNYQGHFREDQLAFLENYLAVVPKDELVVLAMHIPLNSADGQHEIPETRRLLEILSSHPHTLSISGHTHYQKHWHFGAEQGYAPDPELGRLNQHVLHDPSRHAAAPHHHGNFVTVSGSWYGGLRDEEGVPHTTMRDGAPNGYTLIHFDGNRYRTEFRAARRPADHQMTLHVVEGEGGGGVLYANVFNGMKGDVVEVRIVPAVVTGRAATGWMAMAYTEELDPLYVSVRNGEAAIPGEVRPGGVSPRPQTSYHLWKAEVPAGLLPGTHLLEVRHVDQFGVERRDRYSHRVE